MSTSRWGE